MKHFLHKTAALLSVILAAAFLLGPRESLRAETPGKAIVAGYYAGWSAAGGYTPDRIPADRLTHLHYAFARIDPATYRIAPGDPVSDPKNFQALSLVKKKYPHLKTLISVGGWDYSTYFSDMASTEEGREAFASSCVDFLLQYGFDGVDLDWEYPVSGGPAGISNRPEDKRNFTLLLAKLREKLDQQGKLDGKKYYLTAAGGASRNYLAKIEPRAVSALLDYFFVMTYDMHGPWDAYADLNAPLYMPSEPSVQYQNSVSDGVAAYLAGGVPAGKIVMGIPFYGYVYQGVSDVNQGLYSPYASAKAVSYRTIAAAYLNTDAYLRFRHPTAHAPYLYGNGAFITYDDPQSAAEKTAYALSQGLGGVGVWELSQDAGVSLITSISDTVTAAGK